MKQDKQIQKIEVAKIKREFFVRVDVNQDRVRQFVELITEGIELPPIVLNLNAVLLDGRHRLTAYEELNFQEIEVEIVDKSDRISQIGFAFGGNYGGALPPSVADTRHTVGLLMEEGCGEPKIKAALPWLPMSVIRDHVRDVNSQKRKMRFAAARAAVANGMSVTIAAGQFSVDLETLKYEISGETKPVNSKHFGPLAILLAAIGNNYTKQTQFSDQRYAKIRDLMLDGRLSMDEVEEIYKTIQKRIKLQKVNHQNHLDRLRELMRKEYAA